LFSLAPSETTPNANASLLLTGHSAMKALRNGAWYLGVAHLWLLLLAPCQPPTLVPPLAA
jgi:hypothetical protein